MRNLILAVSMIVSTSAIAQDFNTDHQPTVDWDALANVEPGDLQSNLDAQPLPSQLGYDLWECRVVSETEYATGNYPGGTICFKIAE